MAYTHIHTRLDFHQTPEAQLDARKVFTGWVWDEIHRKCIMGFRGEGLGFKVWGLGFRVIL